MRGLTSHRKKGKQQVERGPAAWLAIAKDWDQRLGAWLSAGAWLHVSRALSLIPSRKEENEEEEEEGESSGFSRRFEGHKLEPWKPVG